MNGGGREALIAAAVRLFQARGYHGVGVADILSASGLPKGSLYHHFPRGKEELAAAAASFIADEVDGRLATLLASHSPQAAFEAIAHATAGWLKRTRFAQGALLGVLAGDCGVDTPLLTAAIRRSHRRWTKHFEPFGPKAEQEALAALAWLEGAILIARTHRSVRILINPPQFFAAHSAAA